MTRKPCQGCGEVSYTRKADELCANCQILIQEAKNERLKRSQIPETQCYTMPWRWYALPHIPYYQTTFGETQDTKDKIQTTFFSLLELSGVRSHEHGQVYLIEGSGSANRQEGCRMKVAVREDLNTLYHLIVMLSKEAYAEGKKDGQRLLTQLASGEMSINDFNERTIEG
jgi:hypothetical protein